MNTAYGSACELLHAGECVEYALDVMSLYDAMSAENDPAYWQGVNEMSEKKVFLGHTKRGLYGRVEAIYLYDFSWECGWYWGGGYLGNWDLHCHFDGCFLNEPDRRGHPLGPFITPWDNKEGEVIRNGAAVWEDITFFLDHVPEHIARNWWRIKDLFIQFYALREAAEVFRHGGHCSGQGRTAGEIVPEMAKAINEHIEHVIIPEIRKVVGL